MKRTLEINPNQLSLFDYLNRLSFEKTSYLGNSHSVIYFVFAPVVNRVKIGLTKAGKENGRLSGLQVGSPVSLTLVGTVPGDQWLETRYHNMFRLDNHHGEWFDLTPPLKQFIQELLPNGNWELFPNLRNGRDGQAYLKSLSQNEIADIERELRGLPKVALDPAA